MTTLTTTYRVLTTLVLPFAARRVVKKLRNAGIATPRAHERLGHATQPRPMGDLVWIHAASVGESKSALVLIDQLLDLSPSLHVLVTTGTPSSAEVLAEKLPARAFHQFAPLDGAGPVSRFLRHWRPNLGIFIESEIWPNLIRQAHESGVALALLNARLSDRALSRWARFPTTAKDLLGRFGIIHTQDLRTAAAIGALGLTHARRGVNLKSVLAPPRIDAAELSDMRTRIGSRPVWAAVSTHPGEEEIVIEAHRKLREVTPDALLILVPRHPERADDIRPLCSGMRIMQRSRDEAPVEDTAIYLADTLGETDLWFALCRIVCLCGSFSDVGGHTPYEPAIAGAAILHGPNYANFEEVYAQFHAAGASLQVQDAETLFAAVSLLLGHPDHVRALGENARPLALAGNEELNRLAVQCLKLGGIAHF